MVEPITYEKVYDTGGGLEAIRLVQGGNRVAILLGEGLHRHGGRWGEVKKVIDRFSETASKEAQEAITSPWGYEFNKQILDERKNNGEAVDRRRTQSIWRQDEGSPRQEDSLFPTRTTD